MISAIVMSCMGIARSAESFRNTEMPDIGLIGSSELDKSISSWIVLDARPREIWSKKRIKGALSFSWEKYTRTDEKGIPYRIEAPEVLAEKLGGLGIDENSPVVIYGDADTSWGGEGWAAWTLSFMGHKGKIRLLEGGIAAWEKAGLMTETGDKSGAAQMKKYGFNPRKQVLITTLELKNQLTNLQIIDTRSFVEWVKGHIEGAKRIEWTKFYEGEEKRPISPEKLKSLLNSNGVDTTKPVVYYCTGGIRSGYAWLVHELAGLPQAMNYEEGMVAWDKR